MNQYVARRRLVLKSSNAPRTQLYVFRLIRSISIARLSLNVPADFPLLSTIRTRRFQLSIMGIRTAQCLGVPLVPINTVIRNLPP